MAVGLEPFFSHKHEGVEKDHAEQSELRSCHRVNGGCYESEGGC